jgi:hypothetical protein
MRETPHDFLRFIWIGPDQTSFERPGTGAAQTHRKAAAEFKPCMLQEAWTFASCNYNCSFMVIPA